MGCYKISATLVEETALKKIKVSNKKCVNERTSKKDNRIYIDDSKVSLLLLK